MLDDNSYGFEAYYQFQRATFLIELSSADVMATIVSGGMSGVNSNASLCSWQIDISPRLRKKNVSKFWRCIEAPEFPMNCNAALIAPR
jgi:hypothetical protein